jgi:hypothetical protein
MIASSLDLESQLIAEEIDNILENYPEELTQEILGISEFRAKIIAYVINRLEQAKIARNEPTRHLKSLKKKVPYRSLELRLAVEQYIIEAITNFLGVNLKPLKQDTLQEKSFVVLSTMY